MMTKEAMTQKRAEEIALILSRYKAARTTFELEPFEEGKTQTERLAEKMECTKEEAEKFLLHVLAPATMSSYFGRTITITDSKGVALPESEASALALKYIRSKSLDISPSSFESMLERVSKGTGISEDGLREFYVEFISPYQLEKIKKK